MTTEEKLKKLYDIKETLSPLALILVVPFQEMVDKNLFLKGHDIEFIESVYELYFGEESESIQHDP